MQGLRYAAPEARILYPGSVGVEIIQAFRYFRTKLAAEQALAAAGGARGDSAGWPGAGLPTRRWSQATHHPGADGGLEQTVEDAAQSVPRFDAGQDFRGAASSCDRLLVLARCTRDERGASRNPSRAEPRHPIE